MAVEMSPRLLEAYGFKHQPANHLRIKGRRLRAAYRWSTRAVSRGASAQTVVSNPSLAGAIEGVAGDFQRDRWAYIEPFFTEETQAALVDGWPPRAFFAPMKTIVKSYDFGFKWIRGQTGQPEHLQKFKALEQVYELLRSAETAERVTDMCGDGRHRTCYSLATTWAHAGSTLVAHRDSIAHSPDDVSATFLNFVIFVDGTGGEDAGGTCIAADNEYQEVIFEPTQLTNSALVYQSVADFYHGFKPMKSRTFRWTINAQFAAPDVYA